jgi:hypothetical protein
MKISLYIHLALATERWLNNTVSGDQMALDPEHGKVRGRQCLHEQRKMSIKRHDALCLTDRQV